MDRYKIFVGLLLATLVIQPVRAQPAAGQGNTCFFTTQFRNWKAADEKTIYISVLPNRYYRLDLSGTCPALLWPGSHLVTVFRGSTSVCSAIDWELSVSQAPPNPISERCIVRNMTLLSTADADAIPPKFKPHL